MKLSFLDIPGSMQYLGRLNEGEFAAFGVDARPAPVSFAASAIVHQLSRHGPYLGSARLAGNPYAPN